MRRGVGRTSGVGVAWLAVAMAVFGLGAAGCRKEAATTGGVLAKVGSASITQETLDERVQQMPSFARAEFQGPEGRKRLLDRLIEEEMMYQAALDAGLVNDPEISRQIRDMRRRTLVEAYYRRFVEGEGKLSDAEVDTYYREHPEEFTDPDQVSVGHVLLAGEEEAQRVRARIVSGAVTFEKAAAEYSTDERTKAAGGLIPGFLAVGRPVGSMGNLPELVTAALALEPGQVSNVVKTNQGFHILQVQEKRPGRLRPLEEVRGQIQSRGSGERVRAKFQERMTALREKYRVQIFEEQVSRATALPVEEVFRLAQEATDPARRIAYYQQVLNQYPNDKRCYEAQFMIGFVYSEDLKNFAEASRAFQAVLDKYPTCDLAESARWMIANMGKEPPGFQGTPGGGTGGGS